MSGTTDADKDAVLDSTVTRNTLVAHDGSALALPKPEKLPVQHFALNINRCRESWEWKQTQYYEGLCLCRDSDSFP